MEFRTEYRAHAAEIAELVRSTFAASEGEDEGAVVGGLAARLMAETPDRDLRVMTAWDDGTLAGAILFSRLVYDEDDRDVFVLGPVAVLTERQGQGIGQDLITFGLGVLRKQGVAVAVTYGDPNYYGRVGFRPIDQADIPAPYPLQLPHGWLGQSLTDAPLSAFSATPECVDAMADPAFW